jgi:hypothetical protein
LRRPKWEGGEYDGEDETRFEALMLAMELGAEYVDIELKVGFACIYLYLILAWLLREMAMVLVNLTFETWVTNRWNWILIYYTMKVQN